MLSSTDHASKPPSFSPTKIVEESTIVNSKFANNGTAAELHKGFLPTSLRSAMDDSTGGLGPLRGFAVTLSGRAVMVSAAPPALPPQIIPHNGPWPAADLAWPINPEGYIQ